MNIDEIRKIHPTLRYWCEDGCGWHYEVTCPDCGDEIEILFTGLNIHNNLSSKENCTWFVLVDLEDEDYE